MAGEATRLYDHFSPPERLALVIEAMARDDAQEAQRLQRSCPRATYTGRDPQFEDRWDMAFDTLAVVSIDLRAMWAKLHVLRWVIDSVHPVATAHNITASLAFLDGFRCAQGQGQMQFFARPLPEPDEEVDYGADAADEALDDAGDEEVLDPSPEQVDEGLRLDAVERRSEHFTACGMVLLLSAADGIAKDLVNTWAAFGAFCRTRVGVEPETMLRAWQFPLEDFRETLKTYGKVKPDPRKVKEYSGYICKHWDRRFRRGPGSEYVTYSGDEGGGDGE